MARPKVVGQGREGTLSIRGKAVAGRGATPSPHHPGLDVLQDSLRTARGRCRKRIPGVRPATRRKEAQHFLSYSRCYTGSWAGAGSACAGGVKPSANSCRHQGLRVKREAPGGYSLPNSCCGGRSRAFAWAACLQHGHLRLSSLGQQPGRSSRQWLGLGAAAAWPAAAAAAPPALEAQLTVVPVAAPKVVKPVPPSKAAPFASARRLGPPWPSVSCASTAAARWMRVSVADCVAAAVCVARLRSGW